MLVDTDNSVVIAGVEGLGEVEESRGAIIGDRKRLNFGW